MTKKFILPFALSFFLFAFNVSVGQVSTTITPPGFKYAPSGKLPVISMPEINVDSMLAEDAIDEAFKDRPFRFGYNHLVNFSLENSGLWTVLANGDRIWQVDVKTPGSYSVNLAFSNFELAPGAKLFVYSKDHQQVLGEYTSANNTADKLFATALIIGDEAVVEFYEPVAVKGQSKLTLFRITQGYKDLNNRLKAFGDAGSCIHNINCPQYGAYSTQKRAVVCILLTNGNALCSGALVNNTLNDGTPYILTANHCGTAGSTWVFLFNWEAPGCANPNSSPPAIQSITAGTTVAQSVVSDFNLVRMSSAPPQAFHPFYLGWNHDTVPATSVTCIHHPSGDIKKCSQANNPVTDTFYDAGNGTALVWQIGQWTDGVTEPGSSGSPLLDQNKRVVGQLYGGPSACGETVGNLRDYYGRFCVSWDSGATAQTRLKDWLDPNNIDTLTNDGYDPFPPNDTLDLALTGIVSPGDSTCTNDIVPAITVQNLGSTAITSFTVKYHVDGGGDSTFVWTGTLMYLGNAAVSLPGFSTANGAHVIYVSISLPNGHADQNHGNDSAHTIFTIYTATGINTPIVQGFEGGLFPPVGWTITTPASGTTWTSNSNGAYGLSSTSVNVDEFSPVSSTAGEKPGLISPSISMTHATNPAKIKFDVAYAPYDALHSDSLAVLYSTDCGNTWTNIYQKGGTTLATANDTTILFVPTAAQWRTDSVDITNLIGQPAVLFNFQVISGYGNVIYLDNINIADTLGGVGIMDVQDDIKVNVFPNPFTDNFSLQFTLDAAQNIDAGLYSVEGKKLFTLLNNQLTDAGSHHVEINTQQLSNGVYFLKVNQRFFKIEKVK